MKDGDSEELAFVALGSNLGDSKEIIRRAFERLQILSTRPLLRSSLWRTTPVDCPPGSPPFVNAMAGLHPAACETPESFLRQLQSIETELGRQRGGVRNEPRMLDLDLIAFGRNVLNGAGLILPHPRAHLRRFVLAPMAEIAPEFVLPGQSRSVRELLRDLPEAEMAAKLE